MEHYIIHRFIYCRPVGLDRVLFSTAVTATSGGCLFPLTRFLAMLVVGWSNALVQTEISQQLEDGMP